MQYEDDYSIGSINSGRYIFLHDLFKLKNYYENNYEQLKEDFKIPPGNEFGFPETWRETEGEENMRDGFEFVQNNKSIISADKKTKAENVFADEFPVQYIDENADILSGFINMKVW